MASLSTAACSAAAAAAPATSASSSFPRCDSSDCLVCQGQRTLGSAWLVGQLACEAANGDAGPPGAACAVDASAPQQAAKRLKRVAGDSSDPAAAAAPARPAPSPLASMELPVCYLGRGGERRRRRRWAWRDEWAGLERPAPCEMVELAALQSPAELSGGDHGSCRRDMVCSLDFTPDGRLLAAAGVSKQVALYSMDGIHQQQREQQQQKPVLPPVALLRLPAKVSSICWSPDMEGVLTVGDYDGTLMQVHAASGHYLHELDCAHSGRIWSVAHSSLRPHLAATASDDGSAKLWEGRAPGAPAAELSLPCRPAVCGAHFSPDHEHLLALAAADAAAYLFDLRRPGVPLAALRAHSRPVSYAKFFGPGRLVTASTDGTVAAWELGGALGLAGGGDSGEPAAAGAASGQRPQPPSPQQQQQQQQQQQAEAAANLCEPWKVFRGHTNAKHFVGLAVQPAAGLMAVGSETNEAVAYHSSWSDPLAAFAMGAGSQRQRQQQHGQQHAALEQLAQPAAALWRADSSGGGQQCSVSAVAWQPLAPPAAPRGCAAAALLAAATTSGDCRLLALAEPC